MTHETRGVEFTDHPRVLVLSDSEAGIGRGRRTAELAGCRVSDTAPIVGAVERLARQAAMDAVLVEVEADPGEPLDLLLTALNRSAREGGMPASFPHPLP
jgi:hypothetical protein